MSAQDRSTPLDSIGGTGVGPSREPRLREEDGKASGTSGATQSSRTAADPGNAASVPSSQDRSTPLESVVEEARAASRVLREYAARSRRFKQPLIKKADDAEWTADLFTLLANRVEADRRWMGEAALALEAASVIGEREGCHLNYGNHDRLLAEYRQALSTQPHQDR